MVPFFKSLNTKLLLLIALIVAMAGGLTAFYLDLAEYRRLEQRLARLLQADAQIYTETLADEFSRHRELISAIVERFEQEYRTGQMAGEELPLKAGKSSFVGYVEGKAFRRYDRHSSIFLPQHFKLTASAHREIDLSAMIWDTIAPLINDRYNPVFFVSRHGYMRVSPPYRAISIEDHFRPQGIPLYQKLATKKGGEEGVLQGSLNFDKINALYNVGLAAAIEAEGEFLGIIGGAINLSQWSKLLLGDGREDHPDKVLIFDGSGRLVLDSTHFRAPEIDIKSQEHIPNKDLEAIHIIAPVHRIDSETESLMARLAKGEVEPEIMQKGMLAGVDSYYVYQAFPGVDWYLLLGYDQSRLKVMLHDMRSRILLSFAVLVAFLSLILTVCLKHVFTNRILELSKAAYRLRRGQWHHRVPESGSDEISTLGLQINKMADTLSTTFSDLKTSLTDLQKANLNASKFTSAIEHSSALVVMFDAHWVVEYTNNCFKLISGHSDLNLTLRQALLLRDDDKETEQAIVSEVVSGGEWLGEYAALDSKGDSLWLQFLVYAVNDERGAVINYVATGRNVTDVKESQIKMERLAFYDALTGLQNRLLFRDQLEREINICQREKAQLALMYLDLDHFKRVNDTMGHDAGDELLITVANRLRHCLRQEDAVARFGGDEFAIMLTGVGSPHYASIVANKIISELNKPIYINTQEVQIGVSIGITLAPHDGSSLSTLFKNADLAMYQAKDKGRNSFQFFTQDMNLEIADRIALERDLKQALKNHEFVLYFQPQVDLSSGDIVGAEALIRWNHSQRGLRSPLEFIPLAEETGLIVPLGKWILRTACQQAKSICKSLSMRIPISVNLSARQLVDKSFVDTLDAVLQEVRLDPCLLELEVTESLLMDNIDEVIDILNRIRQLGVRIAIDDFGTGYSSLSYIKRLPINRLKIDRSFIKDLPENQEDREITSLIIAMAKNLKLEVLAEGAESGPQVDLLTNLDCDYAQGFFHSKPVTADQLMILLFERKRMQEVALTD